MDTDLQYALFDNKYRVIQAIREGAGDVQTVNKPTLGPTTYERTDYPYVEILPSSTDFEGGNEWSHTVDIGVLFERTDREDDYLIMMERMFEVLKSVIDELSTVGCVVSYLPQSIEDFAGELNGTLLVAFRIQLRVTTLIDLNEI